MVVSLKVSFSYRRRFLTAAVLGLMVLVMEAFVISIYSSILYGFRLYLAMAAALAAAALVSAYVYITEPSIHRGVYVIRAEILKEEALDDLERAIISEIRERGYVRPSAVAVEMGTTAYEVIERVHQLERRGVLRITSVELLRSGSI